METCSRGILKNLSTNPTVKFTYFKPLSMFFCWGVFLRTSDVFLCVRNSTHLGPESHPCWTLTGAEHPGFQCVALTKIIRVGELEMLIRSVTHDPQKIPPEFAWGNLSACFCNQNGVTIHQRFTKEIRMFGPDFNEDVQPCLDYRLIGSMSGIFTFIHLHTFITYIYHEIQPNIGIYTDYTVYTVPCMDPMGGGFLLFQLEMEIIGKSMRSHRGPFYFPIQRFPKILNLDQPKRM